MDVRLAVTGFGNVGQGLAALLAEHGEEYAQRYGVRLLLTGVADRGGIAVAHAGLDPFALLAAKKSGGTVAAYPGGTSQLEGEAFLEAADADMLIEAASTNFQDAEPGWSFAQAALDRKMDLIFASKGTLVLYWDEIMDRARRLGVAVRFSATVGAPLPILELAERVLLGARIKSIDGVVNATSNQILASMAQGLGYDEGVRRAQEMGIAETDPTLDVDGWDAAAKAVIIGNAVLGGSLRLGDVRRSGIQGITRADLEEARLDGAAIKSIVRLNCADDVVVAEVAPVRMPLAGTLGSLRGDEMGVVFHTSPLGELASTARSTAGGGIVTALTCLRDIFNLCRERARPS